MPKLFTDPTTSFSSNTIAERNQTSMVDPSFRSIIASIQNQLDQSDIVDKLGNIEKSIGNLPKIVSKLWPIEKKQPKIEIEKIQEKQSSVIERSFDSLKDSSEKIEKIQEKQSSVIIETTSKLKVFKDKTKEVSSSIGSTVTKFSESENIFAKGIKGSLNLFVPQLALVTEAADTAKDVFSSVGEYKDKIKDSFSQIISGPKQLMTGFSKITGFFGKKKEKEKAPESKLVKTISESFNENKEILKQMFEFDEKNLKIDKKELKLDKEFARRDKKELKISKKELKIDQKEFKISKKELKLEKEQSKLLKKIKGNTSEGLIESMIPGGGMMENLLTMMGLKSMLGKGKGAKGVGKVGKIGKVLGKIPGIGKIAGAGAGLLGMGGLLGGLFGGEPEVPGKEIKPEIKPKAKPKGILGKLTGKAGGKIAGKGIGKSLLKKIPGIGLIAGLGFGAQRLMSGDFLGALGEVGSGAASLIPGAGTAVSLAIDAALAGRDISKIDEGGDLSKIIPPKPQKSKLIEKGIAKSPISKEPQLSKKLLLASGLGAVVPPVLAEGLTPDLSTEKIGLPNLNLTSEPSKAFKLEEAPQKGFLESLPLESKIFKAQNLEIDNITMKKEMPSLSRARGNIIRSIGEKSTDIPGSIERKKTDTSLTPSALDIPKHKDTHVDRIGRNFGNFNSQPDDYRLVFVLTGGR